MGLNERSKFQGIKFNPSQSENNYSLKQPIEQLVPTRMHKSRQQDLPDQTRSFINMSLNNAKVPEPAKTVT
jgi:protein involved in ribonucleotide reduction